MDVVEIIKINKMNGISNRHLKLETQFRTAYSFNNIIKVVITEK
jgi:hypothetical protein